MTEPSPAPKPAWRHNIPEVFKLRREIRTALSLVCSEPTPKIGEEFEILVEAIGEHLPKSIDYDTLFESVAHMAGEPLVPRLLDSVAWRLAGNLDRLRRRRPVVPWHHQNFAEWVPVQVMAARPRAAGKFKPGYTFSFKALAGTPAGLTMTRFWSRKYCFFVSKHMGFSRKRRSQRDERMPERKFYDPRQLISLRMLALVTPELSNREPGFEKIHLPEPAMKWNREQMDRRDRLKPGYTCPQGFPPSILCHRCHFGYAYCPAGTHRLTYTFEECPFCGNTEAPFDADLSEEMCVLCYERKAWNPQ